MTNNNNNNSSGTKKGTARLTTFGFELGYIKSHELIGSNKTLEQALSGYKYHNLPPEEIARRQKVAKKIDAYNLARHLTQAQLFDFFDALKQLSESVRDEDIKWINKYNATLDLLAEQRYKLVPAELTDDKEKINKEKPVWKTDGVPKFTYDKEKIDMAKLKSVIRVWKIDDALRIINQEPYIQKSVMLISDAYNEYGALGPFVKSYVISNKKMNITLYEINKSLVLPEIVDPLLHSFYKAFSKKLSKTLYGPTAILPDDWYEDCS